MNVIPSGVPSWTRTNAISDIDGHIEKANMVGPKEIDPLTDLTAEGVSRLHQLVIASAATAPFGILKIQLNDAETADPTALSYLGQHGAGLSFVPGLTRISDGVAEITWDVSYNDSFGIPGTVLISSVNVSSETNAASVVPSYTLEASNVVRVYGETDGVISLQVFTGGS